MRSLRHAASLLADAHSLDALLPVAIALAFDPEPLALDAATRAALGIPTQLGETRLLRGRGALRALLVAAPPGESLRPTFARLAVSLSARAPSVLWLLVGTSADGEAGVACWSTAARGPRVAALVARRDAVVPSDAEALAALAAAAGDDDLATYTRWCELLGREALSRRFYRTLEQRVTALAGSLPRMPDEDRAELALLAASRLLFLSFLETKGWLDGDRGFLARRFDDCMARGGGFHERVLLPLWFGTLNTPIRRRARAAHAFGAIPFLNGGLFARTALERRHGHARLSDDALGRLFGDVLGAYRFTAREEQARWTETAIDPEMLGRAFESLMAARERRTSGAFYTPQALVSHVADAALACRLREAGLDESTVCSALDGQPVDGAAARALRAELATLTVLDPACGSGAFLVHLLERLADLHRLAGDDRPVAEVRRDVVARAIHGVDVNPTAVWLCELRLWLSVVIESEETRMSAVPPLPNLDCNVRVGDALGGDDFAAAATLVGSPAALSALRQRYARATGPRKATLRRALDREERRRAVSAIDRELSAVRGARRERVIALRSVDLFGGRSGGAATLRRGESLALRRRAAALRRERDRIVSGGALPFSFASHFAHVHARGGFGLVVGNPPWVRLHNIPASARAALRERFATFRDAAWTAGAERAGAGPGFGAQVDLSALFVERSLGLLAPTGVSALLVPAKLWRSLAGGGVRALLARGSRLLRLEDWAEAPCVFDAAVYPSVVVAMPSDRTEGRARFAVRRRSLELTWCGAPSAVRFDPRDDASPWLLLPPDVRAAFDRLSSRGRPLAECALGRPTLGVKCGCNDAFAVDVLATEGDLAVVVSGDRKSAVERALVRPLVRGETVAAWRLRPTSSAIVWTHGDDGLPLATLPHRAARWLAPWRPRLASRSDLRGGRTWWALFRTEGADAARTRVVWCDFGRTPRAAVLPAGDPTVPLNSCYVLACDDRADALAFTALLNSPLAAAWLAAIAEPARGGWHRYLAWTVSLLPLPNDWTRARSILVPLAERAIERDAPSSIELLDAACAAYRVKPAEIAPLLAWCHPS